jgi:hypothetical protein
MRGESMVNLLSFMTYTIVYGGVEAITAGSIAISSPNHPRNVWGTLRLDLPSFTIMDVDLVVTDMTYIFNII